ncbi:hypothetical protein LINPERHAP1_LOCUS3248 [Linum perenne]
MANRSSLRPGFVEIPAILFSDAFLPEIKGGTWDSVKDFVISRFADDNLSSKVKRLLWCMISSSIWRERCARVYGDKISTIESLIEKIRNDVKFFVFGRVDELAILAFV